ncbi:MAG: class I SAM-dependent methyltransferase [Candidatus Magasanikbacteria bacterium]|jgi:SAM-dependent methyltransferase|nr:class I SAM-dependent methyltransferase [Candidatus Magasanikbacteria bacterium]MBT4221088.1 class I SAM-dependent methyltransferase [Candidatus Magasanikbacteria bacterium]MBT4350568.1 class I SAM-dependent methyltransferase [Candidatus Magasanikbacteria bacterium]MBT4542133.1 class I SAM-dependent methyltransferase [Candidatus Magasanikbacteria bacterium]MBT6253255.1 class I SAM-dependent methyltransferase [Candidatus Magasanikbacteria bacterium]
MKTIVDLGCGTGNTLLPYYPNHTVVGIDLDEENIRICKKSMPKGTWIVGDVTTVPLTSFTAPLHVICTEVIEHIPHWKAVIQNTSTLPSSTTLFLTTPHEKSERRLQSVHKSYWDEIGHHHYFSGEEIRTALTAAGWTDITIHKTNAALYFELKALFLKKAPCIRHTFYKNTLPLPLRVFFQLFRKSLFQTRLKWFFPLWMITLPISWILDYFWGATIEIHAKKA